METNTNATTGNGKPAAGSREVPTFDFNAPVEATGHDIPAGNYPGALRSFGECKWLPITKEFQKEGGATEQLRMEIEFAVRLADGTVDVVSGLMTPPVQGKNGLEVNRKSNLFKLAKSIDPNSIDAKTGVFTKGFKLNDLIGKPVLVNVEQNKKEFAQFKGVSPAIAGLSYPTEAEIKALASEHIPF